MDVNARPMATLARPLATLATLARPQATLVKWPLATTHLYIHVKIFGCGDWGDAS